MNFSPAQWMTLFLLDFLLKAAGLWFVTAAATLTIPPVTFLIPLAFTATFIHILFLSIGSVVTSFIKMRPRLRFALTLLVAEGLLIASFGFSYFYSSSENPYRCPSFQTSCPRVTASELWQAAILFGFLLAINLLPIIVVSAASALVRFVGRTPRRV